MYKYEEHTFQFSKNDIIEALENYFGIEGSLVDYKFGPYNTEEDSPDFLMVKSRLEYGNEQTSSHVPKLVEFGSLD
ncbi:hypothetical protein PU629_09760 [Pullulanibacillus sp. KACC 23026]|uniref:hypothetical protein n=1 Tax=Pullulanibacillus sp. KACC 23026 TaxID=3028315 RepID=UPI0023AFFF37|nr:hypothetical protein [Pullulanibacillus sp. KACC 23026]WEG14618.1 hypothetical protein PU629_09760 [Pullulanibacillus sp. KACC 23026]